MTRQKAKKEGNLVHLTNRIKDQNRRQAVRVSRNSLKPSDLEAQNLVNATQCHDGPRTLWLPKLENAIYQNFKWNSNQSPLLSEKIGTHFFRVERKRGDHGTWKQQLY